MLVRSIYITHSCSTGNGISWSPSCRYGQSTFLHKIKARREGRILYQNL